MTYRAITEGRFTENDCELLTPIIHPLFGLSRGNSRLGVNSAHLQHKYLRLSASSAVCCSALRAHSEHNFALTKLVNCDTLQSLSAHSSLRFFYFSNGRYHDQAKRPCSSPRLGSRFPGHRPHGRHLPLRRARPALHRRLGRFFRCDQPRPRRRGDPAGHVRPGPEVLLLSGPRLHQPALPRPVRSDRQPGAGRAAGQQPRVDHLHRHRRHGRRGAPGAAVLGGERPTLRSTR